MSNKFTDWLNVDAAESWQLGYEDALEDIDDFLANPDRWADWDEEMTEWKSRLKEKLMEIEARGAGKALEWYDRIIDDMRSHPQSWSVADCAARLGHHENSISAIVSCDMFKARYAQWCEPFDGARNSIPLPPIKGKETE